MGKRGARSQFETAAEWEASPQGRAFMARAEMRHDLEEFRRRSDVDILKAVFEVRS